VVVAGGAGFCGFTKTVSRRAGRSSVSRSLLRGATRPRWSVHLDTAQTATQPKNTKIIKTSIFGSLMAQREGFLVKQ
jgi:hypothetical protein